MNSNSPAEKSPGYDDYRLLKRIVLKDEQAFEILFAKYSKPIYNYLRRLTHADHDSEEILQDVFFVVWQKADRFRGDSTVKTWLFTIAHHQAVSWLRRKRVDVRSLEQIQSLASSQQTAQIADERIRNNQLWAKLDELPYKQRSVVELTFIQGFSYQEIAQVMKCPVGTVKSRMSAALRKLLENLSDDGGDIWRI